MNHCFLSNYNTDSEQELLIFGLSGNNIIKCEGFYFAVKINVLQYQ